MAATAASVHGQDAAALAELTRTLSPLMSKLRTVRIGVYIDGFNLYYGARNSCGRSTPGDTGGDGCPPQTSSATSFRIPQVTTPVRQAGDRRAEMTEVEMLDSL